MKWRSGLELSLLLIVIGGLLSSCVAQSWQVLAPQITNSGPAFKSSGETSVYFYIPQYLLDKRSPSEHLFVAGLRSVYQAFQGKLTGQVEFERVKLSPTPPEQGIFCSIRITENSLPSWTGAWAALTGLTAFIIPTYDGYAGYKVGYEVYIDTKLKKLYTYEIAGKVLVGSITPLAIPFMKGRWEHLMEPYRRAADSLEEALWTTFRLFWTDAQRDGFF